MKFKDVKGHFNKVEFHRPTKNVTGSGIQMRGLKDGSVEIQIAKQSTPQTREANATYAWNDDEKKTQIVLKANETREICILIKKALKRKVRLFDQNIHKRVFDSDPGYDYVKKYHASTIGKTILFLAKEYNGNIQLEMSIYYKRGNQNYNFMFSFTELEMIQLEQLFYFYQAEELGKPEGYMSCVVTDDQEVIRQQYMPPLNIGDMIIVKTREGSKRLEIKKKCFVFSKNMTVYMV